MSTNVILATNSSYSRLLRYLKQSQDSVLVKMKSLASLFLPLAAFAIALEPVEPKTEPEPTKPEGVSLDELAKLISEAEIGISSYIGFEYEGPAVAQMFSSFTDEQMQQVKDELEVLIFDKWAREQ